MNKITITLGLLLLQSIAIAAPIKFNFTFLENRGTGKAVGYIIYEETSLSNPGNNSFSIPNAAIIDISMVVSGTSGGDGNFNLNDFIGVAFSTGGLALDFSRELVGQPTDGAPWGTVAMVKNNQLKVVTGPNFNLLANNQQPAKNSPDIPNITGGIPPSAFSAFVLQASSGEFLIISSFSAHIPIIPTLSQYSLLLLTLILALLGVRKFRKKQI